MRRMTIPIIMACLCVAPQVQAQSQPQTQSSAPAQSAPTQPPRVVPRETPKEVTPIDKFEMKTTDTGDKVQQRLQLDISKNKDVFIYGNRITTYPTTRSPGEDFQPAIPQTAPKDSFSIGIGVGRRF